MKIVVLGTRGIPDIQGGVETHCQELYTRLAKLGCQVTIITRNKYANQNLKLFEDVRLVHLPHPNSKRLEAIAHTFLGIIYARLLNPDIIHIHAIGPSLLVPFARLLGLSVVVTNHGPDYDRQKWGKLAKGVLLLGERFGTKYANKVIVISKTIKNILETKYCRADLVLIPNGVNTPLKSASTSYITSIGLSKNKYILAVGRFVPEKGFQDLIEAYASLSTEFKLVLVGDADHETNFSKNLKLSARKNGVILTGFIKGDKLNEIYSHARLLVMPSYHEGLPITLLEAMSYGLDYLVSNIPANLEIPLARDNYFDVGNINMLEKMLFSKLNTTSKYNENAVVAEKYFNWDNIALSTLNLYCDLLNK